MKARTQRDISPLACQNTTGSGYSTEGAKTHGISALHDLFCLRRQITQFADVIACAIIKRQQPASDLLTKRQAYAFAGSGGLGHKQGRGWIDNHITAGLLTTTRRGSHPNSPIVLSRAEIVALHEAELLNEVKITHRARILKPNTHANL